MKGESEVVKTALNGALRTQLMAINQFFMHARMLKNWGLDQLNQRDYKQSITAMKLADNLIERILFLEGLPNLQNLGKLLIGEDVPEILQNDLALQVAAVKEMQDFIAMCEANQDYISRELLEELLEETEEHIDWIETQQWLIENAGLQNYLQSVM
jgi:bacterioferritin